MNENVAAKMVKKHHTDNLLKQTQSYYFFVCGLYYSTDKLSGGGLVVHSSLFVV